MFSYKIQSYQEDGSLDVVPFLEGNGLYLTSDPGLLHLFTREVTPAPLALPVAHQIPQPPVLPERLSGKESGNQRTGTGSPRLRHFRF